MPERSLGRYPELVLVRQAARAGVGSIDREAVGAAVRRGPDWTEVVRGADRHGVIAGLAACLSEVEVPAAARGLVASTVDARATQSLALTGTLLQVVDALEREGIDPLAFKGATLAASAYGGVTMRQFLDNDVLVAPAHADAAERVLLDLGYAPVEPVPAARRPDLVARRASRPFTRRDAPGAVDLHWGLAPWAASIPFPMPDIRARAVEIDLGSRTVRTLGPEDMLIALCVHGSRHRWARLLWVADVAAFIRSSPALRWGTVFDRAESWRVMRMVTLGLALARAMVDASLPSHVLAIVEGDAEGRELARACASGWLAEVGPSSQTFPLRWFDLRVRERVSDRTRIVARSLFVPSVPDWGERDRPAWSAIRRPVRLLRTYGPELVSRGRDELRARR